MLAAATFLIALTVAAGTNPAADAEVLHRAESAFREGTAGRGTPEAASKAVTSPLSRLTTQRVPGGGPGSCAPAPPANSTSGTAHRMNSSTSLCMVYLLR